jgi:hypothetical protein
MCRFYGRLYFQTFRARPNKVGTYIVTQPEDRVARWHIFKPKIIIWINFGMTCNGS